MNNKDKKIADESLDAASPVGNMSEDHSLTIPAPVGQLARQVQTVDIAGFDELPVSMIALPYLVIVQSGTDVYLADNKTPAPKGVWYATDTQEVFSEVSFVPLRALVKEKLVRNDDTGKDDLRRKLHTLCVNLKNNELFIMSLPPSSWTGWGRMMAQLKKKGVATSYEYEIKGTLKPATNKKGQKFYTADFVLVRDLQDAEIETMMKRHGEYAAVLDKQDIEEGEVE